MTAELEFFKVLGRGGKPHMGTGRWTVGKRKTVRGPLVMCRNGLHVCARNQLVSFLDYGSCIHPVVEASEERIADGEKVALRYATLGPAYPGWNERTARLFAADCAERALRRERRGGGWKPDPRSWAAVKAARLFADGKISRDELAAARAAAGAAFWAAAGDTAAAADGAAVWAADGAAAWAAAAAAAGAAARAAVWDTAAAAAWAAERRWQTKRLFDYIEGRRG